jgi:hypothetical protein
LFADQAFGYYNRLGGLRRIDEIKPQLSFETWQNEAGDQEVNEYRSFAHRVLRRCFQEDGVEISDAVITMCFFEVDSYEDWIQTELDRMSVASPAAAATCPEEAVFGATPAASASCAAPQWDISPERVRSGVQRRLRGKSTDGVGVFQPPPAGPVRDWPSLPAGSESQSPAQVQKKPAAVIKKPSAEPQASHLCKGWHNGTQIEDCIFNQTRMGWKSVPFKSGVGQCVFCNPALMTTTCATATGTGNIVRALKKYFSWTEEAPHIYAGALNRVRTFLPERHKEFARKAAQPVRKKTPPKEEREAAHLETMVEQRGAALKRRSSTLAEPEPQASHLCKGWHNGTQIEDCIFNQKRMGWKSVPFKSGVGQCVFCNPALMTTACATATGTGSIVRALKKYFSWTEEAPHIYAGALNRVRTFLPERHKEFARKAAQPVRKKTPPKEEREAAHLETMAEQRGAALKRRSSTLAEPKPFPLHRTENAPQELSWNELLTTERICRLLCTPILPRVCDPGACEDPGAYVLSANPCRRVIYTRRISKGICHLKLPSPSASTAIANVSTTCLSQKTSQSLCAASAKRL